MARINNDILTREFSIEPQFDAEKRTVELSFSSEFAADRGEYMEVLSHDPKDVDLSRLNNGHPLLLNHDPDRLIGVVESARIDSDKKGRAIVRFSKSQLADEIWKDCVDGIRRLVSVGYRRTKEVASEKRDNREFVRFAWTPHEISICAIPCDAGVGIGRAQETKPTAKTETIMEVSNTPAAVEGKDNRTAKDILAITKNLIGKVDGIRELADKAIAEDWTTQRFQQEALNKLPEAKPMERSPVADVKPKDWRNYSITRAICGQMEGKLTGFEKEISDEVSLKLGSRAQGFWLPQEALVARNFIAGTDTLGGMLVDTVNQGDMFIELLRNKAKVAGLGARLLTLGGPVTIPKQNAAGAANWVTESTAATLSTGNFTNLTLTPRAISAFQQYSKDLLFQSNPSIDGLVRDDINNIIALAIDLAALHGSGSPQPTGIANTTGVNTVALAANGQAMGNATAFPALVSLETMIAADNAEAENMAYLIRPSLRGTLKVTQRFASTDSPVWEGGMSGVINGYRAEVTNQIATNLTLGTATTICSTAFFGNWADLMIAQFAGGATDLVVDPYVLAANGVVRVIARKWVDCGVRHPESFALLLGIL